MAREVILTEHVSNLGAAGAIVKVADGYARNFLFPKKMAAPVTDVTRRILEKKSQAKRVNEEEVLKKANQLAGRISNASCTIAVKTGEGGKLFGSITAVSIAEALKEQNIELDKNLLQIERPIRELGVFTVPIKLHAQVIVNLKVWVVEE